MGIEQILQTYGYSVGTITVIVFIALKWKQIGNNTTCIQKIDKTLIDIQNKLSEINEHMAMTNGYLKGLKNGKRRK
jgi:hypothetical protein